MISDTLTINEEAMKYYIHYNGGKIYYSDTGEGETVVLLHGYLETSDIWSGFAKKLAGKFRVISCRSSRPWTFKGLQRKSYNGVYGRSCQRCFLKTLTLNKVFLTGHSLGGYVALAFLELYPGMLKGYCLFHSHPFADRPETVEKREREIKIVRAAKKYLLYPENISQMYATENLDRFREELQRSKDIASTIRDEGIIAVLNGMMNRPSRLKVMEEGKVPCLWILGRMDNYISCDEILTKVNLPANAKVVVLDKSGHMGFVEEADPVSTGPD